MTNIANAKYQRIRAALAGWRSLASFEQFCRGKEFDDSKFQLAGGRSEW